MRMNKRGMTLIELIIVIAIMGIIAGGMVAITFPLLKMQKKTATEKKLNEISDGLKAYYLENGHFPGKKNWAKKIAPYVGKAASEISKDGWNHKLIYKPYKTFGKEYKVQDVTVISYGSNKKAEGSYDSFPGEKSSGSDDIVINVSHSVCAQEMVEKTKNILSEVAGHVYSGCTSDCDSEDKCKTNDDCGDCVKHQLNNRLDAWGRSLSLGSCAPSSSDLCSCIVVSGGDDPVSSSDDVKRVINWSISTGGGSSGGGGSHGGGGKNKGGSGGGKGRNGGWWPPGWFKP